jgi:type I restriction enzyme M protein
LVTAEKHGSGKTFATQASLNSEVKSICDIMRRSNCAGALQYVPELTWILFLRILDEHETQAADAAEIFGTPYTPSLSAPYRWQDWAAPKGAKRKELGDGGKSIKTWINTELLPHLRELEQQTDATPRQKVISEVMSGVERVRIDSDKNLLDVLDKVNGISNEGVDVTHIFTLSQVYEGLLLKMGEKGNDGGQFFTPREVIRVMVQAIAPQVGQTVYDPCCGTGGFLAQAHDFMRKSRGDDLTGADEDTLKHKTFYGREKDNLIYPIALANLILHGIDEPHIWHGNTLTQQATYEGLFTDAAATYDVILTNPPFGGKEGKEAQTNFIYKTGATQVLFVQHILNSLKAGGRCGIVLDEGVLFRTNETAFVKTKRKLLDDCNLWCILSLPGGVFTNAGAGVKTNLLFFTKGQKTERIWYYDLSDVKVGKKTPMLLDRFKEFFDLLPTFADSDRSWTIDLTARRAEARKQAEPLKEQAQQRADEAVLLYDQAKPLKSRSDCREEYDRLTERVGTLDTEARDLRAKAENIENAVYDLKAVNPNAKAEEDTKTPEQLLNIIAAKGREVEEALTALRATLIR